MLTAPGRHLSALADRPRGQRLGRDEEHGPDAAEGLAEAPVLDDVADGVGAEELGATGVLIGLNRSSDSYRTKLSECSESSLGSENGGVK